MEATTLEIESLYDQGTQTSSKVQRLQNGSTTPKNAGLDEPLEDHKDS